MTSDEKAVDFLFRPFSMTNVNDGESVKLGEEIIPDVNTRRFIANGSIKDIRS